MYGRGADNVFLSHQRSSQRAVQTSFKKQLDPWRVVRIRISKETFSHWRVFVHPAPPPPPPNPLDPPCYSFYNLSVLNEL